MEMCKGADIHSSNLTSCEVLSLQSVVSGHPSPEKGYTSTSGSPKTFDIFTQMSDFVFFPMVPPLPIC